jgi:hypothetical protein
VGRAQRDQVHGQEGGPERRADGQHEEVGR